MPAFPGAEGFGAATPGGRGGAVFYVTTLNDAGPGSLREALGAAGPRMVLFRVSGVIALKSPLRIRSPFVTVAGQTAPGDGICLRDQPLVIETHDVVVRHLRSRLGNESGTEADALSVSSGSYNVILDHISASWSVDETLSVSGDLRDVTVQWSLIGESLRKSLHQKGAHGYGSLVRAVGGVSLHHNIWSSHTARNPRLGDNYGKGEPLLDVRQNLVYNWGDHCTGMVDGRIRVNYAGNLLIPGPDTKRPMPVVSLTEQAGATPRFYVSDIRVEGVTVREHAELFGSRQPTLEAVAFPAPAVTPTPLSELEAALLASAGATRPRRDEVDRRIVDGIRRRQGRIVDGQGEVGGWPRYQTAEAPPDSDGDGMPDSWETARGLNPKLAEDGARLAPSGYSNLEEYLNQLAR